MGTKRETPLEAFERIIEGKVERVMDAIRILNQSITVDKEWSAFHREAVAKELQEGVDSVAAKFDEMERQKSKTKTERTPFSFKRKA